MGITNAKKTEICDKYRAYLEIIDLIGNKVMLQKQLIELVLKLGIAKHTIDITKAILELEHYEIIKKEQFLNTTHKVIVFKKFAIRYLTGATRSKEVGAVPKSQSPERVLLSVFKSHYILTKIIPNLQKQGVEVALFNLKEYLKVQVSSVLYSKNEGVKYFNQVNSSTKGLLSAEAFESLKIMQEQEQRRQGGLNKGSQATEGKGNGKLISSSADALGDITKAFEKEKEDIFKLTPKQKKLEEYSFDSMLNAFIYIAQIKMVNKVTVVTVLDFDLFNKQDLYRIALNISAVFLMLKRYFKDTIEFKLKYGVITYDQVAQNNLMEEANRKSINPRTKEFCEKGRLLELFRLNEISEIDWESIEVKFVNYNITNSYLEGIKYLNIAKSGGRPKGAKNKSSTV